MVLYYAIVKQDPAWFMASGKYYFDLFSYSKEGLDDLVKRMSSGSQKVTEVKSWVIRGGDDPKGLLEDYDRASEYIKKLNAGTISPKDLPSKLL